MRNLIFDGLLAVSFILFVLSAFIQPAASRHIRIHLGWLGVAVALFAMLFWRNY
jgi:hypothetical protein